MAKAPTSIIRQRRQSLLTIVRQTTNGITSTEIHEEYFSKMSRRTIDNDLTELENAGFIYKDSIKWFSVPMQEVPKSRIDADAEEALTLYLATRLLVKHTDRRNEIVRNVLYKVADVLHTDTTIHKSIIESARQLTNRPIEENYQDIYRIIMRATLYKNPVEIRYRPYRSESFTAVIHPYLIEPSGLGYATYVIAHNVDMDKLRTYKLERIQSAKLLVRQKFDIPKDFPGLDILQNAWSIFHGDKTIEVVLRFHPDVVERVLETNWHSSMQLEADGQFQIMRLQVADTTDLTPWIRGWGANCEVLAPIELREEMEGEARRIAELYGWHPHRNISSQDDDDLNLDMTFDDFYG